MNTTAVAASFDQLNKEIAAAKKSADEADRALKSAVAFAAGFAITIVPAFLITRRILTVMSTKTEED